MKVTISAKELAQAFRATEPFLSKTDQDLDHYIVRHHPDVGRLTVLTSDRFTMAQSRIDLAAGTSATGVWRVPQYVADAVMKQYKTSAVHVVDLHSELLAVRNVDLDQVDFEARILDGPGRLELDNFEKLWLGMEEERPADSFSLSIEYLRRFDKNRLKRSQAENDTALVFRTLRGTHSTKVEVRFSDHFRALVSSRTHFYTDQQMEKWSQW